MVETPALDSAEADLVAILAGRTPPHQGRWTRERRIARGTYHYLGDDGLRGTEEWEIFSAPDDKTLVHSRLQLGDSTTETWQRSDADGVTNFVEITRQTGPDLSRSRFWIEDGHVQSVTRGNATGIVEQTLELPDGWTVLLPVAVSAISSANGGRTRALRLEAAGAPTSGRLYLQELQINGREEITTPAGRFEADRIVRRVGGTESVWWLHPDLEVPVQGQREDGARVVLVEVEQFGDSD